MKAAVQITKDHYHKHGTVDNIDDILLDLEEYASQCLNTPPGASVQLPDSSHTNANVNVIPMSDVPPISLMESSWGPSALDWAGWDWNDLSHLFQNSG